MPLSSRIIVAIPVKNEETRIGLCLQSLARQTASFDRALLLLNNCTDRTLQVCETFARRFGKTTILQCELRGASANAGEARRLALDRAGAMAGDGVVLTTDADAAPDENWVADNLRALERGADAVCGRAELDPLEAAAIPAGLREDEREEARLLSIQDEIAAMIDPDPADPWPRHQQQSGASLAVRAAALRKAGGAPSVATGEDRALIARLRWIDARIRHAPEIAVRVSGRLEGRAEGGMAATLKRRMVRRDLLTDDKLEPTVDAYRRVLARARLRAAFAGREDPAQLAEDLLIAPDRLGQALASPYHGTAWAAVEAMSPVLHRRRVAFADLRREIQQAAVLLDQLREERIATHIVRHRLDNAGENAG